MLSLITSALSIRSVVGVLCAATTFRGNTNKAFRVPTRCGEPAPYFLTPIAGSGSFCQRPRFIRAAKVALDALALYFYYGSSNHENS